MSDEITGVLDPMELNECTRIASLGDRAVAPLGPREALLVARERLAVLAGVARGRAFVIAAVDASARVTASLVLHDRRALIVGRHTQCGLHIDDDTVSLRHVAVLVRFEGARPGLHVRDLATDHPFLTEDGHPNGGVIADGPLYVSIGSVAIWFLPCPLRGLHEDASDAWLALAPRSFVDRQPPAAGVRPAPEPAPHPWEEYAETTQVTRVAAPLLLGDGDDPEVSWGVLRVIAGDRREKRAISAERLEQGVLLGRYGRCSILSGTPESSLSRVHALLLRLGAEVWILDTASTHGVTRAGEPVLADVLRDTDSLALGPEVTIEWERVRHAEA